MPRSLRTRLIVGIALGQTLLLGLAGFVLYGLLRSAMIANVDDSLEGTAKLLAPLVEYDSDHVELEVGNLPDPQGRSGQDLMQIWLDDDTTIARSAALEDHELLKFGGTLSAPEVREFQLRSGTLARAAGVVFVIAPTVQKSLPPRTVTLVVARSVTELYRELDTIRHIFIGAYIAVVAASVLVVIATVTRGLRPVHVLASQIEHVNDNNLHQRIDAASLPAELRPVAERLNQMLARLDIAFERERGFTADAAHELRTPLAGIRNIADVALAVTHGASEYQQAISEVRDIGLSLEGMVERLLMLARLDSGQIEIALISVDLRKAVGSAWMLLDTRADARGITFENHVPAQLAACMDPVLLKMILINLLDNAVEYANADGRISVASIVAIEHIDLTISNTGCEVTAADVDKVFERFWRGDLSRSATGVHCGLGLTLVRRAMIVLGGEAKADVDEKERVFSVHLRIPLDKKKG